MKNITVTVADDVYRAASARAAEQGSSVSDLVRDFLASLGDRDAEFNRLEAQQAAVQQRTRGFRAADRLSREAGHQRTVR